MIDEMHRLWNEQPEALATKINDFVSEVYDG
jgi:hypothetical protein